MCQVIGKNMFSWARRIKYYEIFLKVDGKNPSKLPSMDDLIVWNVKTFNVEFPLSLIIKIRLFKNGIHKMALLNALLLQGSCSEERCAKGLRTGLGGGLTSSKPQFCCFLTVSPWVSYFTSLCLMFCHLCTCQNILLPHGIVCRLNELIIYSVAESS